MSQVWIRYSGVGIILALMTGVSVAQLPPAHDAWLMKNYHFIGPPPPSELRPADPVLTELKEIQSRVGIIMRRAGLDEDYESALAAAYLAVSNTQLIGAITERQQAAQTVQAPRPAAAAAAQLQMGPFVLIALKDKTINTATSYWVDGRMLNYVTVQGVHIIVRMDLVDLSLSRDLNRQRNVDFRLPE